MLNALSTFEDGNAAASSAAAELSAGTVRESKVSKFNGFVDVHHGLPGQLRTVGRDDARQRRVRHRQDDDVAGDGCVRLGGTDVLDVGAPGAQHPAMAVPMLPDPKIVTLVISAPVVVSQPARFGCCYNYST